LHDDFLLVPEFTAVHPHGRPTADCHACARTTAGQTPRRQVVPDRQGCTSAPRRIGLMGHVLESMYDMHVDPPAGRPPSAPHRAVRARRGADALPRRGPAGCGGDEKAHPRLRRHPDPGSDPITTS
jgi:hypothetical protein